MVLVTNSKSLVIIVSWLSIASFSSATVFLSSSISLARLSLRLFVWLVCEFVVEFWRLFSRFRISFCFYIASNTCFRLISLSSLVDTLDIFFWKLLLRWVFAVKARTSILNKRIKLYPVVSLSLRMTRNPSWILFYVSRISRFPNEYFSQSGQWSAKCHVKFTINLSWPCFYNFLDFY